MGGLGWDQYPGGNAEQRQARVAQKAATSEPDLRELFVAETLLKIETLLESDPLLEAYRHARLPPFARFFLPDLYETLLLRPSASGFHELYKVGGTLVQIGLSGYRFAFDLQDERRAFKIKSFGQIGRLGV